MGDQDGVKDRNSIHLLLPDHRSQTVVRRHKLLLHSSLIEHFRSVTKEISILEQERLRRAMRVIHSVSGRRRDRDGSAHAIASAQELAVGPNAFRAACDWIKLHLCVRLSRLESFHRPPLLR